MIETSGQIAELQQEKVSGRLKRSCGAFFAIWGIRAGITLAIVHWYAIGGIEILLALSTPAAIIAALGRDGTAFLIGVATAAVAVGFVRLGASVIHTPSWISHKLYFLACTDLLASIACVVVCVMTLHFVLAFRRVRSVALGIKQWKEEDATLLLGPETA